MWSVHLILKSQFLSPAATVRMPLVFRFALTQAISQDETNSFVSFSPERCVDCWTCSMVCPRFLPLYQLILVIGCWTSSMASNRGVISRQTDAGVKCDLCEGREIPACVEACPTHALVFYEIEEVGNKTL